MDPGQRHHCRHRHGDRQPGGRAMSKVNQVLAIIDRDATTKMPVTVFEWELPVLEEIHGIGSIAEIEADEVDVSLTASEAFNAMMSKYSQHQNAVKLIYRGGARALAKASGLPYSA